MGFWDMRRVVGYDDDPLPVSVAAAVGHKEGAHLLPRLLRALLHGE